MTTKKATHTPGPWTITADIRDMGPRKGRTYFHLEALGGREYLAAIDPTGSGLKVVEIEANAALIGAALELLEALKAVVECTDKQGRVFIPANGKTMDAIRSAIRKAEGGQ